MTVKNNTTIRYGSYWLSFFLLCLVLWLNKYFGRITVEQILYHFSFGAEGMLDADPVFAIRFVKWCVLPPPLFAAVALYAEKRYTRQAATGDTAPRPSVRLVRVCPAMLMGASLALLLHQVSAAAYVVSQFGPDYFAQHYVRPQSMLIKGRATKNLVLIYAESLEATYANRSLFGHDLLRPIEQLGGATFREYQQAPGTQWTIAAMVATQCGVPLKRVIIHDETSQGQFIKSFLPNAVCLSDVLQGMGYRNVFLGGASLEFGGKGKFLRDHHYQEAYGSEQWRAAGYAGSSLTGWGLHDDDLFTQAKSKLRQLHAAGRPFNVTLLTVDTHEPTGYLSPHCQAHAGDGFAGVVQCTAEEIADLVTFMKDSGYLKDTNVVIIGDHLSRKNPVFAQLEAAPERTIFNTFVAAEMPVKNREAILHFDLYPTILEFLGADVVGGRLGLGYSAFYKSEALPPPGRLVEMQHSLLNRSDLYLTLWHS